MKKNLFILLLFPLCLSAQRVSVSKGIQKYLIATFPQDSGWLTTNVNGELNYITNDSARTQLGIDTITGGDNWGSQIVETGHGLMGDGTIGNELEIDDAIIPSWVDTMPLGKIATAYQLSLISAGAIADGDYGDVFISGGVWNIDLNTIGALELKDTAITTWLTPTVQIIPTNSDSSVRTGATIVQDEAFISKLTSPALFFKALNIEDNSLHMWAEGNSSVANAAGVRRNFTISKGFNLSESNTRIDSRFMAFGESWESFYHPTLGDSIFEYHKMIVDMSDVQHRIESYTLPMATPASWQKYYTLSEISIKDPTNDDPYAYIARSGTTGSSLTLLGSASGKGTEFASDNTATNLQITNNFSGTSRTMYLDQGWDNVNLPSFTSYIVGVGYYNRARGYLLGWGDNDTYLGTNGFRFADADFCALKITDPGNYSNVWFRVSSTGVITAPNLPVFANDAAAGIGGVISTQVYQTATGELRIKL